MDFVVLTILTVFVYYLGLTLIFFQFKMVIINDIYKYPITWINEHAGSREDDSIHTFYQ